MSGTEQPKVNSTAKAKAHELSKSRFCLGVQCLKALYLKVHEPDLASPIDAAQQMIFDSGTAVGIEARKCYPGGTLIDCDYRQSKEALGIRQIKATFWRFANYRQAGFQTLAGPWRRSSGQFCDWILIFGKEFC